MRARGFVAFATAAVLVAGCGDNLPEDGDGVESGTRLRAIHVEAGGARVFTGAFFDLELGRRCTFEVRPDVEDAYCYPAVVEETLEEIACDLPRDADVPLAQLAHGRVEIAAGKTRLRERFVRGDDGSRQPVAPVDAMLRGECELTDRWVEGWFACHPRICSNASGLADEGCTTDLLGPSPWLDPTCACALRRPNLGVIVTSDPVSGEATSYRAVTVGERLPPFTQVSSSSTGADGGLVCEPAGATLLELYRPGSTVELVGAERRVLGAGRMRTEAVVADGQTRIVGLFDHEIDLACAPVRAADGVTRCLPDGAPIVESVYYTDAACTEAVRVTGGRVGTPYRQVAATVATSDAYPAGCSEGCEPTRQVFAIGPTLAQLHARSEDTCVSFDVTDLRVVGPELRPERFVAAVEVIE